MKVVMLTSYTNEAVLVGAIEAGCSGYITKHEGSEVMANGVRLAASGEALVSTAMLSHLLPRLSRTHRNLGSDLTSRELEVLALLAEGTPTKKIAERLYLSPNTVRNHVQSALTKLGVHSRLEAVSAAVREGLIRRA
jgi:DNA-binding NarL/FixJ family response regulator